MDEQKRNEQIENFDPNGPGKPGNLFGLPFDEETANVVIIPVPWEVTVSYRAGTADGPEAILEASSQVDLFIKDIPDAWKMGVTMLPMPADLKAENEKYRDLASSYIRWIESDADNISEGMKVIPRAVDEIAGKLRIFIRTTAREYLEKGRFVGLVGGDHSTPLGLIDALSEKHEEFGILQIDAHADLREAYEDFRYSHASIMFNALKIPQVSKLVQVGIRDLCEEEAQLIAGSGGRIVTHYNEDIQRSIFRNIPWHRQCQEIIESLPEKVYISFDIDGLDPKYCPNTGTPVPGGLEYDQVLYLIKLLVQSGRKIIGFDLNEVAPGDDEWDANVGARVLFQLSHLLGASQGLLTFHSH